MVFGLLEKVSVTTGDFISPDGVDETSLSGGALKSITKITSIANTVAVVKSARRSVRVGAAARLELTVVVGGGDAGVLASTVVKRTRISASLSRSGWVDVDESRSTSANERADVAGASGVRTARRRIAVIDKNATAETSVAVQSCGSSETRIARASSLGASGSGAAETGGGSGNATVRLTTVIGALVADVGGSGTVRVFLIALEVSIARESQIADARTVTRHGRRATRVLTATVEETEIERLADFVLLGEVLGVESILGEVRSDLERERSQLVTVLVESGVFPSVGDGEQTALSAGGQLGIDESEEIIEERNNRKVREIVNQHKIDVQHSRGLRERVGDDGGGENIFEVRAHDGGSVSSPGEIRVGTGEERSGGIYGVENGSVDLVVGLASASELVNTILAIAGKFTASDERAKVAGIGNLVRVDVDVVGESRTFVAGVRNSIKIGVETIIEVRTQIAIVRNGI